MTRAERAAVVELLRCAADNARPIDPMFSMSFSRERVGASSRTRDHAMQAIRETTGEEGPDWVAACLEAALRVELGLWP